MNQELKIEDGDNQKRVIKHLRLTDYLLVILPMVLAVVLLVIVPIRWSISTRESGNTTEIGGFNYDGYVIIAGIFLCFFFCVGYGLLALILSFQTRHNRTFRIILVGILLSISTIFSVWFFILPAVLDFFS